MCVSCNEYARVICQAHGGHVISRAEYNDMHERAEWACPACGQEAELDEMHFWTTHGAD